MIWFGLVCIAVAMFLWYFPGTRRAQLAAVLVVGCIGGFLSGQGYGRWSALDNASTIELLRGAAGRMVREVAPESCPARQEHSIPPYCETRKELSAALHRANGMGNLVNVIGGSMESARVVMEWRGR